MVGEVLAGVGIFKAMMDTAKSLKDMNDAAVRNAAVIELQNAILDAQARQMSLVERVSELEEEMARFETWNTEKQRYRLIQFVPGVVTYILKRSEANGEPGHALCANCYERRMKSILQSNGESIVVKHAYVCPSCNASLKTSGYKPPEYAE